MDSHLLNKELNKEIKQNLNMDMSQNREAEEHRNIEEFNNAQNVLTSKKELEDKRDKAVELLKEEIKMQSFFNVKLKNKEIKDSQENIEKINAKINKLKELEEIEKSYEKFYNNYFDESLTEVEKEILTNYMNNQYGDIKEQINEIKNSHENIQKEVNEETLEIEDKIRQYKENISNTIEQRRTAVNDEFEKDGIVKSSKNKKRKGRKKGLALQDKVIGATEETAAMSYDMQHRKKKINKWYKKPPTIQEKDIELNGNEFELVFKNKSGSAMDIKTIMEKIALLDIKIKSMTEDSLEKQRYIDRHQLLSKTLKIVCAANGIDSETGTYFEQKTDEEKLEVKKKVDFANSAYKDTLEDYKKAIKMGDDYINPDLFAEQRVQKEKLNTSRKENVNVIMKETQKVRADMTGFLGAVDKLKAGKNAEEVDSILWGKAIRLCNSYKQEQYYDIYSRKEDLKKETQFYTDFANGNAAGMLEFAGAKLKELEAKGITVQDAFYVEKIKENINDYEKFAVVVEVINYARARSTNKTDFDKFMAEDTAFDKFKNIATMSVISNYSDFIGKVAIFDSLSERKQKALLYKAKNMSEQVKSAGLQFEMKLNTKELQDLEVEEMCTFQKEMDLEYRQAEMKPMYTESIRELQEYVDTLEASMKELELNAEKHERIYNVSKAVKEYITGKMLEEKCYIKVEALNEMKKIDRSSLRYKLTPQHNSNEKAIVKNVKDIMELCEKETIVIKEIETIIEGVNITPDNIDMYMEKIRKTLPDSDIAEFYEKYLSEKAKIKNDLETKKAAKNKAYDKEVKDVKIDKEKEESNNICNMKLVSFYSYPECSKEFFEEYFKVYVAHEVKFNGKKEKDLIKKKESIYENLETMFHRYKEFPDEYAEMLTRIFSNCDEAAEKYNQFNDDSKESIEELEQAAKEKEKQAYEELISKVKGSYEKHREKRVDKFVEYEKILYEVENEKEKKSEYVGLYKEDLLREITDEQMAIYVSERNATVYETHAKIQQMSANAYVNYQAEKMSYEQEVKENDLGEYVNLEEIEELRSLFESKDTKDNALKNKMIDSCLLRADNNMKRYEKMKKTLESQRKTLEEAKKVLAQEMEDESEKYTENAMLESYQARCKRTDKFFDNIFKKKFLNRAAKYIEKYMNDDEFYKGCISKISDRFIAYKEKVEALIKEKECDTEQVNYLGITYNTIAIQEIILNTDKDKYRKIEKSFGPKHKEEDDLTLYKSDFTATETESGYTTVNFEKLMYKRHQLMEWIEFHSSLEEKEYEGMSIIDKIKEGFHNREQQEYYERKETLEKLNKFLKLYCEANGVDFETGELLCEKEELTPEIVKKKVISSSKYLDETMDDIKANYLEKKNDDEESEEGGLLNLAGFFSKKFKALGDALGDLEDKLEAKTGSLNEKEKSDPEVSLFAEVYSKELFNIDTAAYTNEINRRTAHTTAKIVTKIAECKASAKAGIALGYKAADEELERGRQIAGGVTANAEASFTALSSEFLVKYSNKLLNMNVEAYAKGKVDIGHAKANAGLQMGLKNEKGEISPHLAMEAGLELALLKLEGSVGGKIMGAGVEAQLSFIAGLVAKANVSFNKWKLEIELEAALGIGAGVKLTFDFSELKEKLFNMAKEKGGAIADTVCEKLCRWGFYSQRDMWYDIIRGDIDRLIEEGVGLMNENELKEEVHKN